MKSSVPLIRANTIGKRCGCFARTALSSYGKSPQHLSIQKQQSGQPDFGLKTRPSSLPPPPPSLADDVYRETE
ncbi:MAG: hypothetical protein WC856_06865 [Methylococcaceae bacterium]|jgi:hypothetical protein